MFFLRKTNYRLSRTVGSAAALPCVHADTSVILCILALHKRNVSLRYVKATQNRKRDNGASFCEAPAAMQSNTRSNLVPGLEWAPSLSFCALA